MLCASPLPLHILSSGAGGPKGAGRGDALLWESLPCPRAPSPVTEHPLQILLALQELEELLGCQAHWLASLATLQTSPGGTVLGGD